MGERDRKRGMGRVGGRVRERKRINEGEGRKEKD